MNVIATEKLRRCPACVGHETGYEILPWNRHECLLGTGTHCVLEMKAVLVRWTVTQCTLVGHTGLWLSVRGENIDISIGGSEGTTMHVRTAGLWIGRHILTLESYTAWIRMERTKEGQKKCRTCTMMKTQQDIGVCSDSERWERWVRWSRGSRRSSALYRGEVYYFGNFMFCWPCISIDPCNENQLNALFTLSLFRQSTSTCFWHICSPSSGGMLYIYNWYVLYIYSIPPDDGPQICPKYVEVNGQNKLGINNASSWFSLHGFIEMHGQQNIKFPTYE